MKHDNTKERGAALMLGLMAVLMAGLTLAMDALLVYTQRVREEKRAVTVLAAAKKSLLAYAAVRDALPCPFEGGSESDYEDRSQVVLASASCATNKVGLLPWAHLQQPPWRDNDGGPIWYAVSGSLSCGASPTLTINGAGDYVAILLTPGKALSGQTRSRAAVATRTDYLESSNGTSTTAFVSASPSDTFNDRLLGIACSEIP
ncbi:MAG: hypothetical protein HQL88_08200 [Magnetococcales bacterium]|nr:hypothetical protein [Magnetococcales bacterium]